MFVVCVRCLRRVHRVNVRCLRRVHVRLAPCSCSFRVVLHVTSQSMYHICTHFVSLCKMRMMKTQRRERKSQKSRKEKKHKIQIKTKNYITQ
jgi:hypothetical protein